MSGQEINSSNQAPTPPEYPLVEIRVIRGYRFFTRIMPLLRLAAVDSAIKSAIQAPRAYGMLMTACSSILLYGLWFSNRSRR